MPVSAQQVEVHRIPFFSGSGVVVDMLGHVITNRHVLRSNCTQILVVIDGQEYPAQVVASHPTLDLVLLRAATLTNPSPLPLRDLRLPPKLGEEAMVLGFPGEAATRGEMQAVSTSITGTDGPQQEPFWIRFASAAQQGNSGGPLIDRGGNVLGIVQGKTEITRSGPGVTPDQAKSEADVAISATEVSKFLDTQNIHYTTRWEGMTYTLDTLRRYLFHSIPNVRCMLPEGASLTTRDSTIPVPQGYTLRNEP